MTPSRAESYDDTMSDLLRETAEFFSEAERLRDRIAEIRNDIETLDRTPGDLGYAGDLDAAMPRQKRKVIFGQDELTGALSCDEVRGRHLVTEVTEPGLEGLPPPA